MASTIKFKKEDLKLITEVFEDVVRWKAHRLSDRAWQTFNTEWAPKMIEQLTNNEFNLNHPSKNTIVWFIDQILHSRVLNSSGNPRNSVHLYDTRKGKESLMILRAAARGQLFYDTWTRKSQFNNLFDSTEK